MEFQYPDDISRVTKWRWAIIASCVLGALGVLSGISFALYKQFFVARPGAVRASQSPYPQDPAKSPGYQSVQGRYLFNGTIVLARGVELYARGDYNQPFSQMDTFHRDAYDAWSTDFECPVTDTIVPYQTQVNFLNFNCSPKFLPALTKYFNLINLANNHTDNQDGQNGLAETRKNFDAYPGTQYFGNFDPSVTSDICEVVVLPVRLNKSTSPSDLNKTKSQPTVTNRVDALAAIDPKQEKASLPVAFCAWHYFNYNRGPTDQELAVARDYANSMPVFAFAEMGAEYQSAAGEQQVAIAHQLIDSGAELLLANNPHWVQNAEVYKGKLIMYSLGNFIFDKFEPEAQQGVSLDTRVTVPYDDNVAKWLALGKECGAFKDECLQKAKQQGLKKVKLGLHYAPVANQNGSGKVTHRADAATQSAVEQRLGWSEVLKQLGQQDTQ